MNYITRKIKSASQRNSERAKKRWDRDRVVRDAAAQSALAEMDWTIQRRVIVVDHEETAREIVFFACDRYLDRKRKMREVGALAMP